MQSLAGQSLGKYEILEEVGRGGFATVYRALDTTLDRLVALKVLAPHLIWDTTFVARFKEEARTAANLHHPSIVIIYEVGEVDEVHYIAMEYLAGRNLSKVLAEEGALPLLDIANIVDQLASALDYTHASGLVHRDIKPSNVIISDVGHATLTDFGIVKAAVGTRLTTTGTIMGTPEYMSPEQVTGEELGPGSDIYSLGVVCYEALAGQAPFGGTTASVLHSHVYESPPHLAELRPDLPQGVAEVVDKALAKDVADRFASAGEMAAALRAAIEGMPVPLEPPATVAVRQPPTEAAAAPAETVAPPRDVPGVTTAEPGPTAVAGEAEAAPRVEPAVSQAEQEQLARLYAQARGLQEAGDWQGVLNVLERMGAIDPDHPDPDRLLAAAQQQARLEHEEAEQKAAALKAAHEEAARHAAAVKAAREEAERHAAAVKAAGEGARHKARPRAAEQVLQPQKGLGSFLRRVPVWGWIVTLAAAAGLVLAVSGRLRLSIPGPGAARPGPRITADNADQLSSTYVLDEGEASVHGISISSDGELLATALGNGMVSLWHVPTRSFVATLREEVAWVESVAFSPQATLLATGLSNGTVSLWQAAHRSFVDSFNERVDSVKSVTFSPDGKVMATGLSDGSVSLWAAGSGSFLQSLDERVDQVNDLAFAPDGTLLATALSNGTVSLWRTANWSFERSLREGDMRVHGVAFSPDSSTLATALSDGTVSLWRAANGSYLFSVRHRTAPANCVAFSPDGTLLATGAADARVQLWRVADGMHLQTLRGHSGPVSEVALSPDGSILASASTDGTVRLWAVQD